MKVAYHIDGSVATRTDQRGTVIAFSYDNLRRPQSQKVTNLGGATDGAIRSITTKYDALGRVAKITSHGNQTDNPDDTASIQNQIVYTYNDFSQVGQAPLCLTPLLEFANDRPLEIRRTTVTKERATRELAATMLRHDRRRSIAAREVRHGVPDLPGSAMQAWYPAGEKYPMRARDLWMMAAASAFMIAAFIFLIIVTMIPVNGTKLTAPTVIIHNGYVLAIPG
ncbi:MAG: hypothetical protein KF861_12030, partial [Planctomycetaceae bacterium]|nr:hypothetical protein [Planctomycetaceae bacterium]